MTLAKDVIQVLERDGGLTPECRDALKHLAELAVNDPEKALRYQSLAQEVETLRREVGYLKWSLPTLVAAFALIAAVVALAT
jgi:DNA-directed RNA polymerase subunit F